MGDTRYLSTLTGIITGVIVGMITGQIPVAVALALIAGVALDSWLHREEDE